MWECRDRSAKEQANLCHRAAVFDAAIREIRSAAGDSDAPEADPVATLRVTILGAFRVERAGVVVPDLAWQRRSAKRLVKVLAANPSHAMHREQVFETLWPKVGVDSARNSLAKALHAARQACAPERVARRPSTYIYARDDMIALDMDHVEIDADEFQHKAQAAFGIGSTSAFETALAAYRGILLPEDLYDDWASGRRRYLADLNLRLLVGLAELRESFENYYGAIDCLDRALQDDPTREDVHRRLMRLFQIMGARDLALRQFEMCRTQLRMHINRPPSSETIALYNDLLAAAGPIAHDRAG